MKGLLSIFTLLSLFIAAPSWAVKIYECEDERGNRSFESRCPPGTMPVQEKQYATGKKEDKSSNPDISATLYLIPDCGACDDVKEFLQSRNITITEKYVNDNFELQSELREKIGELKVPAVIIGEKSITGYDRNTLLNALTEAGYTEKED